MNWKVLTLVLSTLVPCYHSLPTVDKGVFVIVGVQSCGNGTGYCILGTDCTIDKEFRGDNAGGHCDGLKTAFTPRANFLCCMLAEEPSTTTTVRTTTTEEIPSVETIESIESSHEVSAEEENLPLSTTSTTQAPTTTTTIYEQKTEISVEQSLSLEILCGTHYGIGEGRVASQNPTSSSCFTAALVRSPTSLFSLSDPGSFLCTGAMITKDTLLTSATCVSRLFQQDLSLFKVILGAKHIVHPSHGLSPTEYRNIKEIHVHKNYNVDGHIRYSDIALVMLEPSNGTSSYCSICLPDEKTDWEDASCIVTGYSHPPDSNDSDGFLHEAPQHIESSDLCNRTINLSHGRRDLSGLICGSGEKSAEACFSPRDAGSPLSCNVGGVMRLAGVFSSGFHCGSRESPVLYTDVRNYLLWVKTLIESR